MLSCNDWCGSLLAPHLLVLVVDQVELRCHVRHVLRRMVVVWGRCRAQQLAGYVWPVRQVTPRKVIRRVLQVATSQLYHQMLS
jgi:hypothetical protein